MLSSTNKSLEQRFEAFCKSQDEANESLRAELNEKERKIELLEETSRLEAEDAKAKVQKQERQISLMMSKLDIPQEGDIDTITSRQRTRARSFEDDDIESSPPINCFGFFSCLQKIGTTISAGRTMFGRSNNIRFHMHSVAAVVQNDPSKRLQQWIFAISSIILVLMQLDVLFWLAFDASHPICATHTDCRIGEYCHAGFNDDSPFDAPRCTDCGSAGYMDYTDKTSRIDDDICSLFDGKSDELNLQAIDQSTVWMSGIKDYHPQSLNITHLACIEHLYCKMTQINVDEDKAVCDHLHLNMVRFGTSERLVFAFVAVLFAAILYKDIEEGTMEKEVLEHGLENRGIVSFPAQIIRLALRIRRMILPWWVAAGTVSIMISEVLSMKNILLNFLAIAFITDADNLIGILLMTQAQKLSTEKFMDDVKLNHNIQVSTTWSKVFAITPSIVMYFSVIWMEQFVKVFSYGKGGNCDDIEDALAGVFFNVSPLIFVALHSIAQCLSLHEKTIFKRMVRVMKEITGSFNALFLTWVWYYLNYLWVSRDWKAKYTPVMIGFVLNSLFMLLLWNCKKRKKVVIWLTVAYWLMLSGIFAWFYSLHFEEVEQLT